MNPHLLQKQLSDNSNDLNDFCKDLKEWSTDMKRKDESLKSNTTENASGAATEHTGSGDAPAKSAATDYAAWDKFDAEKACEAVEKSESDSELSDEYDESLKDEAMLEKEKGNNFVKNQKWDQAIECYTKAIACYGYDPIFYANRALCFLKKEKWKEVETDCTTALKLDKTYVKAYQRRSAARVKLNQLLEAKSDLEEVLKYEPKNTESNAALKTVLELLKNQQKPTKPISKFTQSRQNKKVATKPPQEEPKNAFDIGKAAVIEKTQEGVKPKSLGAKNKPQRVAFTWPADDSLELIEPISKAPHLRSKVPLKRVPIKDIETKPPVHTKTVVERVVEIETEVVARKDGKKKSVSFADVETETRTVQTEEVVKKELCEPATAVQFFAQWKRFNDDLNLKYEYLQLIEPKNLKDIFKEALDSKTFSDILKVLSAHSDDHSFVYNYLLGLVEVKRFCTLVFFMSKADKDGVKALAESLKTTGNFAEEDINNLMKSFDL